MNTALRPSRWLQIEMRSLDELEDRIYEDALYAVIDGCDAPEVPAMWRILGESRVVSLYKDDAEIRDATFAPYLFRVNRRVLSWMQRTLWGTPWGVFVCASNSNLPQLRSHLQQFVFVQSAEGEEMYFRFYDPRVLANYLPTCLPHEIRTLYGPISAYGIMAESCLEIAWWLPS